MPQSASALVLPILLTASVTLNLVQMRRLHAQDSEDALEPGARVPPIAALDLAGKATRVAVTGGMPTLVYVFSPQCGWCERNRANIDALASQLRGRYQVIGVSLTDRDLGRYLGAKPAPFPVVHSPSLETASFYKMRGTPMTVAVSLEGLVERVWQGAFTAEEQAAIEQYFGVRLPGISN